MPCEDFEGVSDVFIRSYVDDDDKKDTDTHFRCSNGKASFNYRILFDVKSPRENPLLLVMQAWDFDLFKSNDYLCEWTLDLDEIFKNVRLTQQQVILSKQYYNAFLKKKMPPNTSPLEFRQDDSFILTTYKDGKDIKLRIDLRIVPMEQVKSKPVGPGRENPNMEPFLPPPIGRIQFSLNPCKMLVSITPHSLEVSFIFLRENMYLITDDLFCFFSRNLSALSSSPSSTASSASSSAAHSASSCCPCFCRTSRARSS